MVGNLGKLSEALSDQTPEKVAEREIKHKAAEIEQALKRDGEYVDNDLGFRICADLEHQR